jgi:hypothetical protein
MKNLNLICVVLLLWAFASCKKGADQQISPISNKPTVIAPVRDSVSYTVDGQTYTAGGIDLNNTSAGYEEADRKLTINNLGYSLIGTPDSIMYFQETKIFSKSANIDLYFLKKFIKHPTAFFYWPGLNDVLTIFTVGKQPLADDFGWQNAKNGIAFNVGANSKGYTSYTSYNAYNGYNTIVFPPGFDKSSTFEIISFTQTTSSYILEAKFSAVVINNATGEQKQLSNGYLRLTFSPAYALN